MGYLHIDNLYKPSAQDIFLFRQCYALEKIHGTSAHIKISPKEGISYFSGGVSQKIFESAVKETVEKSLYDGAEVPNDIEFTVYGEAYGGSCQKMSEVYGKQLKFVVFDVKVGDIWLNVPNAEDVARKLCLEFVHYAKISTELQEINAQRDRPSVQAERNGMGSDKKSEGVVLRPLQEFIKSNGKRVIVKHKNHKYSETKTKREVSPEQLKVLSNANEVAEEWVTAMRLVHVLDKIEGEHDMTIVPKLIPAMIEDIKREGEGEIEWTKQTGKAIGRKSVELLKEKLKSEIAKT